MRSRDMEAALARVHFFASLSPKTLRKVAASCVRKQYPSRTELMREGTTGLGMFLIDSGRVEVTMTRDGRRIALATLGDGDILGEMALLDDQPRSASAVTLEATECLLLTRDSFQTLVGKTPELAWPILPNLAQRVRTLQGQLAEAEGRAAEAELTERPAGTRPPDTEASAGAEPEEEAEPEEADDHAAGLGLARAQVALVTCSAVGFSAPIRIAETFARSLWDSIEPAGGPGGVLRELPGDLLAAGRDSFEEGLKVPADMIRSFRRQLTRS